MRRVVFLLAVVVLCSGQMCGSVGGTSGGGSAASDGECSGSGCDQRAIDRGIYLWAWKDAAGTLTHPVLSNQGVQNEFFSFCASPYGSSSPITTIYLRPPLEPSDDGEELGDTDEIAEFLRRAHLEGIEVHALDGWEIKSHDEWDDGTGTHGLGQDIIDWVSCIVDFHEGRDGLERFDGVHLDVEPTGAYANQLDDFMSMYAQLLTYLADQVLTQDLSLSCDTRFHWWGSNRSEPDLVTPSLGPIRDRIDFLTVMAYRDRVTGDDSIMFHSMPAIESDFDITIAVETDEVINDDGSDGDKQTFFEELPTNECVVAEALRDVESEVCFYDNVVGLDVHHYYSYNRNWEAHEEVDVGECESDADCADDEICVDGECVEAEPEDEPVATPTGETLTLDLGGGVTMELVRIPAGTFMMGSENGDGDEIPVRSVTISQDFYMGKYEVTQGQWQAVMGSNPSYFSGCNDCPVEKVSWYDVVDFCDAVSSMTGYEIRLPTEAEWEYACRAGTTTEYSFGGNAGDLGNYAWYSSNSSSQTHEVGGKLPNPWGLYDMYGNVWEWCSDWYDEDYFSDSPSTDPEGPSSGTNRAILGGSWDDVAFFLGSAFRFRPGPDSRHYYLGFRVAAGT